MRMNEPIRANIKLRCTLRRSSPGGLETEGATEELARDSAIVSVNRKEAAWLRPRSEVSLAVELPSFPGRAPRYLACGAVVRHVNTLGARARVSLEITSMAFRARCK
jgi:hypothetical protein